LYTTETYTCGIGGIEGWYRGIIESFILVALMKYMIFSNPLFLFSISFTPLSSRRHRRQRRTRHSVGNLAPPATNCGTAWAQGSSRDHNQLRVGAVAGIPRDTYGQARGRAGTWYSKTWDTKDLELKLIILFPETRCRSPC
jgi:hypothetical protein